MDTDEKSPKKEKLQISKEVLIAYISAARKHNPKISDNIMNDLVDQYLQMRKKGGKNTISATPRQLESLIRLSEARARLRFAQFVEKEDVNEAVELIKITTQQAATDPVTGVIDIDMIQTGITLTSRETMNRLGGMIRNILRDYQEAARREVKYCFLMDEVRKKISEMGLGGFNFSEFEFMNALRKMKDEGVVAILGNKNTPTIRLIAKEF